MGCNGMPNRLRQYMCTGLARVTRATCSAYSTCKGFYYSTSLVCPSLFESLGGAFGYISAYSGICGFAYIFLTKCIAPAKQAQGSATHSDSAEEAKEDAAQSQTQAPSPSQSV